MGQFVTLHNARPPNLLRRLQCNNTTLSNASLSILTADVRTVPHKVAFQKSTRHASGRTIGRSDSSRRLD